MTVSPFLLGAFLALLTFGIVRAQRAPQTAFLFRRLPVPFYCYFIPTALAAVGLLPAASPLYAWAARFVLPLCLALLLIPVNLPSLAGLSRAALLAMAWGVGGILAGAWGSYALLHPFLPLEAWKSVGALAGSWTGGSANLIAVKESLGASEQVFSPIIVVDALFAYAWMALLVGLAGRETTVDRWNRVAERRGEVLAGSGTAPGAGSSIRGWPLVPGVAVGLTALALWFGSTVGPLLTAAVARVFPSLGASLKPITWTVLAVTTLSLGASFSPRLRVAPARTERLGHFLLLFLLTTLGAQASFRALGEAPAFLALGALWLMIHGLVLAVGARVSRLPLALLATASQACVGGVVSAPMVGAVYRPGLAAVGLLLAVLGNVAGTYLGLMTAQVCAWIGGL